MKKAFTLVELLISFTILAVISGGALVYLNNYSNRQELKRAKSELISALKLAQSYAKTRQVPLGSSVKDLKYVEVQIISPNTIVAGANGIGLTYFRYVIDKSNVLSIGVSPSPLYFWGGTGFLSHDILGDIYDQEEKARFVVHNEKITTSDEIIFVGNVAIE